MEMVLISGPDINSKGQHFFCKEQF